MDTHTARAWAAELADCVRFLHGLGLAPATSANYSFRVEGQLGFHVSASGRDKGAFTAQDFLVVGPDGRPLSPDSPPPSAETLLHALIYQRCPGVSCVLHTHSVGNTVLSAALLSRGQDSLDLHGYEMLKALPGIGTHEALVRIPIFANSQDMKALAAEIGTHWDGHPGMKAFLLAGHGLYTWGDGIATAKRAVEALEFMFECEYRRMLLAIHPS